jgi:DnaJ-class molecular chaperone
VQHKKDYYSILEVSHKATPEEIKKAYRKMALQHHPDKNLDDPTASEKFKDVAEAYEILKDPIKRGIFDRWRTESRRATDSRTTAPKSNPGPHSKTAASKEAPKASGPARKKSEDQKDFDEDTFEGFVQDIFGDFFGAKDSSAPERGGDLRYHLQLDLEDVATGLDKTIRFLRKAGTKEEVAHVTVKIPKGILAGSRLRVAGEGDAKTSDSPRGDLFVVVDVRPHPLFRCDGSDVNLTLPLRMSEAALGGEVEIPTLYEPVRLDIPPGTPTGRVFRLRGKGLPLEGKHGYGDMMVRVTIDSPANVSSPFQSTLREMDKISAYPLRDEFEKTFRNLRKPSK